MGLHWEHSESHAYNSDEQIEVSRLSRTKM